MSKQRDIEIAMARKWQRELMTQIQQSRRKGYEPAPRDPGIKPGGIRDRAIRATNARGLKKTEDS
jgi:hypothetical protein